MDNGSPFPRMVLPCRGSTHLSPQHGLGQGGREGLRRGSRQFQDAADQSLDEVQFGQGLIVLTLQARGSHQNYNKATTDPPVSGNIRVVFVPKIGSQLWGFTASMGQRAQHTYAKQSFLARSCVP